MKRKWTVHGLPFHTELSPEDKLLHLSDRSKELIQKPELKAVGIIVVYISLDRGVIMLASKAFSLPSILACWYRKKLSFGSCILQMETQRRESFAQGHRVKTSEIFVNPNLIFLNLTKQSCRLQVIFLALFLVQEVPLTHNFSTSHDFPS